MCGCAPGTGKIALLAVKHFSHSPFVVFSLVIFLIHNEYHIDLYNELYEYLSDWPASWPAILYGKKL